MLTKEDLNAISVLIKEQFKEGIKGVEQRLDTLENNVLPRLDTMENKITTIQVDCLENSVLPRLDTMENKITTIQVSDQENDALPRLRTIEQCYLDTSKRYIEKSEKFDAAIADIEVMKLAIQKNSADIKELQLKQA